MDVDAAIAFTTRWIDLDYELHLASANYTPELRARVEAELEPFFWNETGAEPLTSCHDVGLPGPSSFVGVEQHVKRVLFKAERWSAPAVDGMVRVYVSDCQTGWTGRPFTVLDVVKIKGELQFVAVYSPCPRCRTTTINKHGEPCTYVARHSNPCVEGFLHETGMKIERGTRLENRKLADPDAKWAPLMN